MSDKKTKNNGSLLGRTPVRIGLGILGVIGLYVLSHFIALIVKIVLGVALITGAYRLTFGPEFQTVRDKFKERKIGEGFQELYDVMKKLITSQITKMIKQVKHFLSRTTPSTETSVQSCSMSIQHYFKGLFPSQQTNQQASNSPDTPSTTNNPKKP